jgi:hypothetical protein
LQHFNQEKNFDIWQNFEAKKLPPNIFLQILQNLKFTHSKFLLWSQKLWCIKHYRAADGCRPAVTRAKKILFTGTTYCTFFDGVIQCRPFPLASSTRKFTSFVVKDEGNVISFCLSSAWKSLVVRNISIVKHAVIRVRK